MPFTYLIGWTNLNKWYYGVRWAKGSSAETLWLEYKTSSKYVKAFFQQHGDPDVIQIRKRFTDKNKARLFESRVLKHLNYRDPFGSNSKWLNRTTNKSIHNATPYIRTPQQRHELSQRLKNRPLSEERRQKISKANTGKKHSSKTKIKIGLKHKGKTMSAESIAKMKANRTPAKYWLGRQRSDDLKDKLSKHRTGKTMDQLMSPEHVARVRERIQEASSKSWIITYPDGIEKLITNLKKFCRDNNLNPSCMRDIIKGRQKIHRGFSVRPIKDS